MRLTNRCQYGRWTIWFDRRPIAIDNNHGSADWTVEPEPHWLTKWFERKLRREYDLICDAAQLWAEGPYWQTMTLRQFLIKTLGPPERPTF